MASETERLIVRDRAGAFYAVPCAALEQWRVSAEQQRELELAVAGGEVQGYVDLNVLQSYFTLGVAMPLVSKDVKVGPVNSSPSMTGHP